MAWVNITDIIYPVGAVYSSYVSTPPGELFGGTWTAITGRFPYYNAGTGTGGSNTHTLTVNEMPNHTHTITNRSGEIIALWMSNLGSGSSWRGASADENGNNTLIAASTGGVLRIIICQLIKLCMLGDEQLNNIIGVSPLMEEVIINELG